jgi:hypothetical protein
MHRWCLVFLTATFATVSVSAATGDSPQAFLEGVMQKLSTGQRLPPDQLYTPRLVDLLELSSAAAQRRQEVGCIDGEPLLDCQECSPLKIERMSVTNMAPGKVDAAVQYNVAGYTRQQRYSLVEVTDRGWRIDDISSSRMPSLRAYLASCR